MEVFEYLRRTIHDLVGVPEEDIHPESTPGELNLDSFDVEELVLDVEEQYDIYLPEPSFETLDDLAKLVTAA
jgi:acyl carrier protein